MYEKLALVAPSCTKLDFVCGPVKRALLRSGVIGRAISPDIREDPVGTLSLLARQGYDLVIVPITFADALATVAPRFPETHFALFDGPLRYLGKRTRNVEAVVLEPTEASYLAGWLAARLEQRRPGKDVVGVVGGFSGPPVDNFIVGFRTGAQAADPGITVLRDYSGDFVDRRKCEAIARRQIARGAGAVFAVAGSCGLGALQAAKDTGVWGIGVDYDQSVLGPHILTSVVKGYEAGFLELFGRLRHGEFHGGRTTVLSLGDGGADLGRISPRVPASLRSELARVRERLIAGKIHVPSPAGG